MISRSNRRRATNRGYMLMTTITFITIISVLLAGVSAFAVSHKMHAEKDSAWVAALDIAEAGANTELAKISRNFNNADQYPGTTYSFNGGTYKVWVTQRNHVSPYETTPWAPPNDMYVYSEGTYNGVTRTVKVSVKGHLYYNRYAVFGISRAIVEGSVTVNGLVGTNGLAERIGSATINGNIELCGPTATSSGILLGQVTTQPLPRQWQTVDELAWDAFPQGGMDWLRTHNDNARVGLPANGDMANIMTPITLIGPGEYYVRSIILSGANKITFNNAAGRIRLWIGKTTFTGLNTFTGTSSAIPTASNQVDIYCAATGGIELAGNTTVRCNVYAYNENPDGTEYGTVIVRGSPILYGSILGWIAHLRGSAGSQANETNTNPTGHVGYYGYDNYWAEGRMNNSGSWTEESRY